MEIAGVTSEDIAQAQALQNVLKNSHFKDLPVTEAHAVSRSLVWLRDLCIALGRGYAKKDAEVAPATQPTAPEGGGLKIKEYHPGEAPKAPRAPRAKKPAAEGA